MRRTRVSWRAVVECWWWCQLISPISQLPFVWYALMAWDPEKDCGALPIFHPPVDRLGVMCAAVKSSKERACLYPVESQEEGSFLFFLEVINCTLRL